jgi:hypothetical protein
VGSISLLSSVLLCTCRSAEVDLATWAAIATAALAAPWLVGALLAILARWALLLSWRGVFSDAAVACHWAGLLPFAVVLWHTPLRFAAGCLFAAFAIGFSATLAVRAKRSLPPALWDRWALALLLLTAAAGLLTLFQVCIYHDALWTYGYLRSILLDRDLNLYDEFLLRNSHFMYVPHPNTPVFYSGLCLFVMPFFLLGHCLALCIAAVPGVFADGYTWPYTVLSGLAGVSSGTAALCLMYRIARRFFDVPASLASALAAFWAGNLCFYTFVWPLYSHAYAVLVIAAFLLLWFHVRADGDMAQWTAWGGLYGLATWIRPENVVFGLLAFAEWLRIRPRLRKWQSILNLTAFLAAAALCFAPQAAVWLKTSGQPLVDVYARIDDQFFWFRPKVFALLFSWNKGLLTWTPVFWFALPGLVLLCRRSSAARLLCATCALQVYVVACYEFPDGGAGFGCRYLSNCMPALCLGLAQFTDIVMRRSRPIAVAIGLSVFVFLNLSMVVLYHLEMIPHNNYAPTLTELADLVVWKVPWCFGQYALSTHINENVFARLLFAGVETGNARQWLTAVGGLAAVVAWLALVVRVAWRSQVFVLPHCRILGAGLCMLCAAVAMFILTRIDHAPYRSVCPLLQVPYERQEAPPGLAQREFVIDANTRDMVIPVRGRKPVSFVDLLSTQVDALEMEPLSLVAELRVIDADGHQTCFEVRSGRDTGEYSLFRHGRAGAASLCDAGFRLDQVVHHWLTRHPDGDYYYGAGYWSRYHLAVSKPLRQVRLKYLPCRGRVIVTGVNLVGR